MTEDIFTGILEAYRKDEISINKAKRQIRLLLDPQSTSDVVNKNAVLRSVSNNKVAVCPDCKSDFIQKFPKRVNSCLKCGYLWQTDKCKY